MFCYVYKVFTVHAVLRCRLIIYVCVRQATSETDEDDDDDHATFTSCDNNAYVSIANKGLIIGQPVRRPGFVQTSAAPADISP